MAHSALDSAALNAAAIGVHLEGLRLAYPEIADDLDEILEIAKSIVEDVDGIISNLPDGK